MAWPSDMIQPGKNTNYPTSSGIGLSSSAQGLQGMMGQSIYKVDGFSITIGIVIAMLGLFLIWQMYGTKGRRRR